MSERGSFTTEFIYCPHCLKAVQKILIGNEKRLNSITIPNLPIIAGKVGGSYQGEELTIFELEYIPILEEAICHPMRIAVLADEGEKIFTITPI